MTPFPDAAYPPPRVVADNRVHVRLDYDDAVLLYELLRDDVCTTSLISSARRKLAAAWALEIFDAIDKFEKA